LLEFLKDTLGFPWNFDHEIELEVFIHMSLGPESDARAGLTAMLFGEREEVLGSGLLQ
jgi:hypothetical protein